VAQLKYFLKSGKNQNLVEEEIQKMMKNAVFWDVMPCGSGHDCDRSVLNLLTSRLRSKNVKIVIYKTIILPLVLYVCETLSLTLREEGVCGQGAAESIWTEGS
jgi:hypothetical protein